MKILEFIIVMGKLSSDGAFRKMIEHDIRCEISIFKN